MTLLVAATLLSGCVASPDAPAGTDSATPATMAPADAGAGTPAPAAPVVGKESRTSSTYRFTWVEPKDVLLPGEEVRWQVDGPEAIEHVEVILESDDGAFTLCSEAETECWMPSEMPAEKSFSWWVRGKTSKGIIRSEDFAFRTPETAIRLVADPPTGGRLLPGGGVRWTVDGGAAVAELALLSPTSGGGTAVCRGPSGCTVGDTLTEDVYDVEVRAYDARGLYATDVLQGLRRDLPPASPAAAHPRDGTEVPAGEVRISWSASRDPEQTPVVYTVMARTGDGEWATLDVGDEISTTLDVPSGETTFWRVEAKDAAGNAVWSPIFRFSTPGALPSPLLTSPILGVKVPPHGVVFEWQPQGESEHVVHVRQAGGEWEEVCSGRASCRPVKPLLAGAEYSWKLVAVDRYLGESESAVETFRTVEPVVLLHGLMGSEETWIGGLDALVSAGFEIVDFAPAMPGIQPLVYRPSAPDDGIRTVARSTVASQVEDALRSAAYPSGTPVALVGHSMGGLIARELSLVAFEDHPISHIVTLGTPHLGSLNGVIAQGVGKALAKSLCGWIFSFLAGKPCEVITDVAVDAIVGPWRSSIDDLSPFSDYVSDLDAAPAPAPYRSVAGSADALVGIASATHEARMSVVVPMGHRALTGQDCVGAATACAAELAAIDLTAEWLLEEW